MSKRLLAFRHETRNFPFKWPGLSVPKWLLPRFGWPRILWEGQSRRNRIFGSIANYWNIGQDQLNFLLPRESLKGGESISGIVVVSHPLPLPSLNSPLERYPFPRWLSTVCNKREIGEAEWRKRGEGKGEALSENKVTRLVLPPPRDSRRKGETSALEPTAGAPSPSHEILIFPEVTSATFHSPQPLLPSPRQRRSFSLSLFLCLSVFVQREEFERCYF